MLLTELIVESGKSLPVSNYQLQRQTSGSCGCVMGPGRAGGEGVSGQEGLPGTLPWSRRVQAQRASSAPRSSEDIRPPLHSAVAMEGPGRSTQVCPPPHPATHTQGNLAFYCPGQKIPPSSKEAEPLHGHSHPRWWRERAAFSLSQDGLAYCVGPQKKPQAWLAIPAPGSAGRGRGGGHQTAPSP